MASLLFCLFMLPAPAAGAAEPLPLVRAVDLDAGALLADPALIAADTLALVVESRREAFYKLSERGEVLAAGKLIPGANPLRFTRPGLYAGSQALFFQLELLAPEGSGRKFLRVQVTVEGRTEAGPGGPSTLSGIFRLEMYHDGRLFAFRKKKMTDLLKLKTGPVIPIPDPALSGAPGGDPAAGQSVSILGLGMALAKFLAGKKAEKRAQARAAEARKKRLVATVRHGGRDVPVTIELQVE